MNEEHKIKEVKIITTDLENTISLYYELLIEIKDSLLVNNEIIENERFSKILKDLKSFKENIITYF